MPSQLPETIDPLRLADGTRIASADDWHRRRAPELRELFQREVYGRLPAAVPVHCETLVEADDLHDGSTRYRGIELELDLGEHGSQRIQLALFTPKGRDDAPVFVVPNATGNHSTDPHPAILGGERAILNPHQVGPIVYDRGEKAASWPIRSVCERGYALATWNVSDAEQDDPRRARGGLRDKLGTFDDQHWGAVACWAWTNMRVLDALEQTRFVDASRAAVAGMSRRGKAALVTGAFDPRFKLVIPHQSGTGGMALSRRDPEESVERITQVFPHWFGPRFAGHGADPARLPFDQHLLIALCAPRAVLGIAGDRDTWASPALADEALRQAAPVWRLLGADDAVGIHRDALPAGPLPRLLQLWRDVEHQVDAEFWRGYLDATDRHLA